MRDYSDRAYAVIDITNPPSEAGLRGLWDALKAQGIIQTSFESTLKSLDGTKMLIKWNTRRNGTPEGSNGRILWQGTRDGAIEYLQTNSADWVAFDPLEDLITQRLAQQTAFSKMATSVVSGAYQTGRKIKSVFIRKKRKKR